MRMHLIAAVVGFSVVGASAAPISAQTLADLAQKVEDSRKAAKTGTKTYTNADAGNVPAATAPSSGSGGGATAPAAGAAAAASGATGATAATGGQTGQAAPAGQAKDEAYYANKSKDLRAQLDRNRVLASAVQTQVNSLTTDFVNRDDPAQRSIIEQDRNRAISELARLQKQIEADQKAIADFEEEARRDKVPPGWLR